ncbi:UMP kinase [Candidatus Uhrbacteria bacterium]|nr:UMP kinase [Candidatus Uhrbacteria bacterium]
MTHTNSLKPTTLVVSVGGSLVVPNGGVDHDFLKELKKIVKKHVKLGWKFVIVVGGGGTARQYQEAARKVGALTREDLDWLGIHSTRLNGHLVRTVFREIAHPVMIKDPTRAPKRWNKPVMVAAGWKPGWSTDYVATRIAKRLKSSVVINLSNIDYVYDKDPNKYKGAKIICDISWKDFRKMVGSKWDPGMNVPFDPVASKLASNSKMKVALLNGKNFENLDKLLKGERFVGTVIGG